MRPILLALNSENQMLPSGPAASARGPLSGVGIGNSVITPAGVMRPILPPANSPNQMLPSAPSAIARGWLFGVGMANSVMHAGRRDPAHPVAEVLGEPHVAVGPERDDARRAAGMRQRELLEAGAVRGHPADAIARASVNHSVPSGRERDRRRSAARVRQRKLLDDPAVGFAAAQRRSRPAPAMTRPRQQSQLRPDVRRAGSGGLTPHLRRARIRSAQW